MTGGIFYNKKCYTWIALIFSVVFYSSIHLTSAETLRICDARLEEISFGVELKDIQRIIQSNGMLYFLEMGNHRIISVKEGEILDQIGRIGNGKGEFYYPKDFFIHKKTSYYVLDRGNKRIQIVDGTGRYIGGFPDISKSWGFSVNSRGDVLLGQPILNKLLSIYNPKGKRLHQFGELINPSDIYGLEYKQYDENYQLPMNRVYLSVDEDDNVWVGFLYMPLILKYNKNGDLAIRKILNIPGLEPLKKAVWQNPPPTEYLSMNIDGIQLTLIIKDMAYNFDSSKLYVLLGDDRILVINSDGREECIIVPKIRRGSLDRIFITGNGDLMVTFFSSPVCYKLVMSSETKEQIKKMVKE